MCGVAGVFGRAGDVPLRLAQVMGATLTHRGPDAVGYLLGTASNVRVWHADDEPFQASLESRGLVTFAHTRLSIIDLSTGSQPLADEAAEIWIVFNGETYNYRALQQQLRARGHRLATASDTEVLVHLYEEKGTQMFRDINGIFAFALWDARNRKLVLARDRVGVKPMYYAWHSGRLYFGSEVRALLAAGVPARPDPVGLAQHFVFQNTLDDSTWFDGIKILPPGHFLVVEADDGAARLEEYWRFVPQPDDGRDLAAWAAEFREQFEETVRAQLVSDVPVGTYLSGGLDTGAIASVAAREVEPLHSFTCGFAVDNSTPADEQLFDESGWAAHMSRHFGTLHHELRLDATSADGILPWVVWHLEEPRAGISYQVALISRIVSKSVRVVLSGVGGDELFAGYPWRHQIALEPLDAAEFEERYYRAWQRLLPANRVADLFGPELQGQVRRVDLREIFRASFRRAAGEDRLARVLAFELSTFLHALLLVEDKLSMASSIETRAPFTDNALLALAARVPSRLKFAGGPTKMVLREALAPLVPAGTLARPKVGFTPPEATWLRGRLWNGFSSALSGEAADAGSLLRAEALRAIVDEHRAGSANNRQLLWSIACFEWWRRLFLDEKWPFEAPTAPDPTVLRCF